MTKQERRDQEQYNNGYNRAFEELTEVINKEEERLREKRIETSGICEYEAVDRQIEELVILKELLAIE